MPSVEIRPQEDGHIFLLATEGWWFETKPMGFGEGAIDLFICLLG